MLNDNIDQSKEKEKSLRNQTCIIPAMPNQSV